MVFILGRSLQTASSFCSLDLEGYSLEGTTNGFEQRKKPVSKPKPVNIYEVHLGAAGETYEMETALSYYTACLGHTCPFILRIWSYVNVEPWCLAMEHPLTWSWGMFSWLLLVGYSAATAKASGFNGFITPPSGGNQRYTGLGSRTFLQGCPRSL